MLESETDERAAKDKVTAQTGNQSRKPRSRPNMLSTNLPLHPDGELPNGTTARSSVAQHDFLLIVRFSIQ